MLGMNKAARCPARPNPLDTLRGRLDALCVHSGHFEAGP
jgi:hypothetical protein